MTWRDSLDEKGKNLLTQAELKMDEEILKNSLALDTMEIFFPFERFKGEKSPIYAWLLSGIENGFLSYLKFKEIKQVLTKLEVNE